MAAPFQGRGVGAALMRAVLDGFDAEQPVHLQVAAFNARAIAFYERFGFRKVEGSDQLYQEVFSEFWMVRSPGAPPS